MSREQRTVSTTPLTADFFLVAVRAKILLSEERIWAGSLHSPHTRPTPDPEKWTHFLLILLRYRAPRKAPDLDATAAVPCFAPSVVFLVQ